MRYRILLVASASLWGTACSDVAAPNSQALRSMPHSVSMSVAAATVEVFGAGAVAKDVNSAGLTVGQENVYAVRYPPLQKLPNLTGTDYYNWASSVNDDGDIVGYGWYQGGQGYGFFMTPTGAVTWLSSLATDPSLIPRSEANVLNNADEIAGRSTFGTSPFWHAAVWPTPSSAPLPLGVLTGAGGEAIILGMAPGRSGSQRLIAGYAIDAGGAPVPVMWNGTDVTQLPSFNQNSYVGYAWDAADNGMVVGWVAETTGPDIPVIWLNGSIHTNLASACLALTGNARGQAKGIALAPADEVLIVGTCYSTQPGSILRAEAVVFRSVSNAPFTAEFLPVPPGLSDGQAEAVKVSATGYVAGIVSSQTTVQGARWRLALVTDVDLALSLSHTARGNKIELLIEERNSGPGASPSATLVVTAPMSLRLQKLTAECTATTGAEESTIRCAKPALAVGASRNTKLSFMTNAPGSFTFNSTLTGSAPDPDQSNNTASTTVLKP